MHYDVEEVKGYVKNFSLNEDGGFTEWEGEEFVGSISGENLPAFNWEDGATKLVIIPENRDYVIKIPFNGRYDYGDFFYFEGACSDTCDDYCSSEMHLYEEAKRMNLEKLFLPLELACEVDGYPIYVQDKAEEIDSWHSGAQGMKYSSEASRDRISQAYKEGTRFFGPPTWIASCLDTLGSFEELERFSSFLDEEGITDLHEGNLGYYDGHAVIIDYGGYHEFA